MVRLLLLFVTSWWTHSMLVQLSIVRSVRTRLSGKEQKEMRLGEHWKKMDWKLRRFWKGYAPYSWPRISRLPLYASSRISRLQLLRMRIILSHALRMGIIFSCRRFENENHFLPCFENENHFLPCYELLQFAWLPGICARIGRGERPPQFLTFKAVTVNSNKFRQRIQELKNRFKETDAKTKELLQDLKEQIKTLESITFDA